MGGINRLQKALNQSQGNRFRILYGPGIEDVFINSQYKELPFELGLYETLIELNFGRILFYSPHKALYVYDKNHLPSNTINSNTPSFELGPLDHYNAFQNPSDNINSTTGIGDFHALKMMDAMMKNNSGEKTALIFLQGETSIRYFDDMRSLSAIVGDWVNLSSSNQNICLFVFSVDHYDGLQQLTERIAIPEIVRIILREKDGLGEVQTPCEDEIFRAIKIHIENSMKVKDIENLSLILANEKKFLRYWIDKFRTVDHSYEVFTPKIAAGLGWISAVRNPGENAIEELQKMIGLEQVKNRVNELVAWAQVRRVRGTKNGQGPTLHMIFSGNPGTGKTTIARLIGEIFHELGWLNRGHLVEVQANDLVEQFVGGTASKTNRIIDQALDGVLFIDEAYGLTEEGRGGFSKEALEILLSRMESDRSRLVVICAGYQEKMDHFQRGNPGLARRFPKENIIYFDDYNENELLSILIKMINERGLNIQSDFESDLRTIVSEIWRKRDPNFGNAGEMRNFADSLEKKHALKEVNLQKGKISPLTNEDLSDYYRSYLPVISFLKGNNDWEGKLNSLVGLASIKDEIRRLRFRLEFEQLRFQSGINGASRPRLKHYVFFGNPGTGKTTVARLLGELYKQLGLLNNGHVIEVSRADLVAGYVGQTATKTREIILRALDGILFIDEAYSLIGNHSDFGKEAIEEIVKGMEDYRDRFVVVAAGYRNEMQAFLISNPGLLSRFGEPILFEDFTIDELLEIMNQLIQKENYFFDQSFQKKLINYLEWMKIRDGVRFGNARSVRELFELIKTSAASRILSNIKMHEGIPTKDDLSILIDDDVPEPGFYLEVGPLATTEAIAKSRL